MSGVSVICRPLFLNMYHYCVSYYVCSRYHLYDMYQIAGYPAAFCAVKKAIEPEVNVFWLSASLMSCAQGINFMRLCMSLKHAVDSAG